MNKSEPEVKLLPCPFCGKLEGVKLNKHTFCPPYDAPTTYSWVAECVPCGISTRMWSHPDVAIESWNCRVSTSSEAPTVKEEEDLKPMGIKRESGCGWQGYSKSASSCSSEATKGEEDFEELYFKTQNKLRMAVEVLEKIVRLSGVGSPYNKVASEALKEINGQ